MSKTIAELACRRYHKLLHRFLMKRLGDDAQGAEEFVQEVYSRLLHIKDKRLESWWSFPKCELCMPACLERAPKLTSVSMILVCRSRYGSRVGRGGRRRSEAAIGGSGFSVLDHRALSVAASGLGTNRSWAAGGLGWNICGGNHGFPYPSDPEVVIDP